MTVFMGIGIIAEVSKFFGYLDIRLVSSIWPETR